MLKSALVVVCVFLGGGEWVAEGGEVVGGRWGGEEEEGGERWRVEVVVVEGRRD